MKNLLILTLIILLTSIYTVKAQNKPTAAELDAKYQQQWSGDVYKAASSADTVSYLTSTEKRIYYYLNLARMNPKLFASTYAKDYKGDNAYSEDPNFEANEVSLINDLNSMNALPALAPNRVMYEMAKCQATEIGKRGLTTHSRSETKCPEDFSAENISFGKLDALGIVMQFLNDAGVASLGHRTNSLNKEYLSLGLSIQSHTQYGQCAVLDFSR